MKPDQLHKDSRRVLQQREWSHTWAKEEEMQHLTDFLLRFILPRSSKRKTSLVGTLNKIRKEVQPLVKVL